MVPTRADDLRALRRWVLVAGVWAVAATAIALIALLDASEEEATGEARDAERQATVAGRRLGMRIKALEARLDDLARAEDVGKLEERLRRSEGGSAEAAADARGANEKASDLERRIEALEEADPGGPPNGAEP